MSAYQPSILFSAVAHALNAFRAEYSRDIASYLTSGASTQSTNYQAGLVFIACILAGFASIWLFVLLVFKCRGEGVFGCAAGYAVERKRRLQSHDENDVCNSRNTELKLENEDCKSLDAKKDRQRKGVVEVQESQTKEESGDEVSIQSSIPSVELNESSIPTEDEMSVQSNDAAAPTTRETRIRIAFLFFALLSLVFVPLVMVFSFAPLKDAAAQTDQEVENVQDVVDRVQQQLHKILSTANSSMQVVESLPLNMSLLCPLVDETDSEAYLGFALDVLLRRVEVLRRMDARLKGNISVFEEVLSDVEDGLDTFESSYNQAETFVWLVPVVLLLFCTLVGIMIFCVVLAWREETSSKLQRIMSYLILPLFVAVTIMCWVFVVTAAVSTASGSDACMYNDVSSNETSPDQLFDTLLSQLSVGNESYLYDAAIPYIRGCEQGKPISELMTPFVNQLQDATRFIWSQISLADSIGRDRLIEVCGSVTLNEFITKALDLADLLTVMSKSVKSTQSALSCNSIRPSYVKVVHDSICTDTMNASASGFLLFLLIGICSLCMISLRSAWRHEIQEARVLKDSEIEMNMIVDEHEEYLAYISKYKHEWEEYNGIDQKTFNRSRLGIGAVNWENEEQDLNSLHDCTSQETPYSQGKRASAMFDPYQGSDGDGRSHASTLGEISFPSLHHDDPGELSDDEYLLRQHSMLLQGSLGVHDSDDGCNMDEVLAPSSSLDHALLMNQYSLPHAVRSGVGSSQDLDSLVSAGEDYVGASPTYESGSYRGGSSVSESKRSRIGFGAREAPSPRNRIPPASSTSYSNGKPL